MKKLLLINPSQRHTIEGNLPKYVDESRGNIPPLGLLYIAASMKGVFGWETELCDMSAGQQLGNDKPDLVGITATTFTLIDVLEVAKQVKERWNVPIILGGIHPTIYPEETVQLPNIDCVFVGESEVSFPQFIDLIASGQAEIVRGTTPDVTKLPMPDYDLLDIKRYYSVLGSNKYLVSMFTSRGCPYSCIFCHRETMGKIFRPRRVWQILNELRYVTSLGVEEVLFYDDTFTVDSKRVRNFCKRVVLTKVSGKLPDFKFDIRARVDNVNEDLVRQLKEAGCHRIHYGVEASNDRMLKVLRKGITIEQVTEAFRITKKVGIETLAYFIIGSPTESRKEIFETIEFAKRLDPDYCHFAVMTPYPATPLYKLGLDQGLYNDYWLDFARNPRDGWVTPYWPEINRDELIGLLDLAYSKSYLRPSYVVKEIIRTRSPSQFVRKGKGAIKLLTRR